MIENCPNPTESHALAPDLPNFNPLDYDGGRCESCRIRQRAWHLACYDRNGNHRPNVSVCETCLPAAESQAAVQGPYNKWRITEAVEGADTPPHADPYEAFLRAKINLTASHGVRCDENEVNPILLPHQRACVAWAVQGGRRALFEAFGLGKSVQQLEVVRLTLDKQAQPGPNRGLIVLPLGVRQEFLRDAAMLGTPVHFVRFTKEVLDYEATLAGPPPIYLTNYESIRDGRLDPTLFRVVSLDEAAVLRSFGSKTFGEFVFGPLMTVPYRFVATATPSPNSYLELIAYAHFLGICDMGELKTRFFKRNSEKAHDLTLHAHKEEEFWLWVSTWALFLQRPSDLGPGFSDEGYTLPEMKVVWHEVQVDHASAPPSVTNKRGQARMFREATHGVSDAAREKRDSLPERIAKLQEILAESPEDHWLLWHDLESERHAIERAVPHVQTVYGSQELEVRERLIDQFGRGKSQYLAAKPVMLGSGCNFQYHCHKAVFLGIGFKFNEFIQAIHRIHRFLQPHQVEIHLIYAESERSIKDILVRKWEDHKRLVERMSAIIREHGLSRSALAGLHRNMGVPRDEACGKLWTHVNNDAILETRAMDENSVDLIVTSIPFSTQYEYSPNYADFGHTDDESHFFRQMDFLTPQMLRVLRPGRIAAIHCKDRVVPGGMNGLGFQTITPFHALCISHYMRHGFAYMGMISIITDVVRENNQTYRLGWTEQCKDGTKMGVGMPEYLLLFRKPPTGSDNSYADNPVVKSKADYTRARWQIDADGFHRSSGNRLPEPAELAKLSWKQIYRLFRDWSRSNLYDHEQHVAIAEALEEAGALPRDFALVPARSWHPDVWTDVTRMRTLNGTQAAKGKEKHVCLARGSRVLTKERGYIPIQNVLVGEEVLTHQGRWRPVLAVQNTGIRKAVTVRAQGVPGLTLTPDHKLWMRKSGVDPDWVEAQSALGGYVNQKIASNESPAIADTLHWWIVGRWLADGHWEKRGAAVISCGAHKLCALLATLGDRAGGVHDTETALQVRVKDPSGDLKKVLRRCGHGAKEKHLPSEAFTLPQEQAAALLAGYLSGDGHFLEQRQRWTASTVSRDLLLGLSYLAQRVHGAIASAYAGREARDSIIQGRAIHCSQDWAFCFDLPGARRKRPFILDDGAWKKVTSIQDAGEVDTWNLRVEEDESFTAEGCIVKNCPLQFDIVDRAINRFSMPGELVLDPFSGLGTTVMRAVQLGRRGYGIELNAAYHQDAVAYCRAAEEKLATPSLFDLLEEEEEDLPDQPETPILNTHPTDQEEAA